MSLWSKIAGQFGKPTGVLGRLAGVIMAHRSSNVERNLWAVSLLELKPTDQVLEIGFGPGLAIQRMAEIVSEGTVWGVDHSAVMLDQASRRNRSAISQGKVKLLLTSVADLPVFASPLDRILDINSFQFLEEPVESLKKFRGILRTGGKIFLVHQPRKPGATEKDVDDSALRFARFLEEAGFKDIAIKKKLMKPVSTACDIGTK